MPERQRNNAAGDDIDLLVSVLRFASLISRPMREGVADPAGLSPNELRLLMALSGEGESAGHDLAELMGMHVMNVSRALTSLHGMGLVEAAPNHDNKRRKPYRVSTRGRKDYQALQPRIAQVANHLFCTLSARERQTLTRILDKLDRQIDSWQPSERHPHVPRA